MPDAAIDQGRGFEPDCLTPRNGPALGVGGVAQDSTAHRGGSAPCASTAILPFQTQRPAPAILGKGETTSLGHHETTSDPDATDTLSGVVGTEECGGTR
jgi:hypothetical protein